MVIKIYVITSGFVLLCIPFPLWIDCNDDFIKLIGTIPAKLLLQLASAFRDGGLCDRSGNFFYKDHLHKSNVPVLAVAGDKDLICPIEAVHGNLSNDPSNWTLEMIVLLHIYAVYLIGLILKIDTAKLLPKHLITYKVFGDEEGPHYAHYDLVGGRQVVIFLLLFLLPILYTRIFLAMC